jgi:hypothetical protein
MPYYVYKIFPPKKLELVAEFADYQAARQCARDLRTDPAGATGYLAKLIFARSDLEAAHMLRQEREKPVLREDEI